MSKSPNRTKLTATRVKQARCEGSRRTLWDTEIRGLGLDLLPSGGKRWVFRYRWPRGARQRQRTLDEYPTLTLEEARRVAGEARLRMASGRAPFPDGPGKAMTVAQLGESFLVHHAPKRSKATRRMYRGALDRHLLPAFGSRPVTSVSWADIHGLHARIGERAPVEANRTIRVVSALWTYATKLGQFPADRQNPGRGHEMWPEPRRGRRVSAEGLARLGEALVRVEGVARHGLTLALLTGFRPSELRTARWEQLDHGGRILRLPETKTGPRVGYLGRRASEVLGEIPKESNWIFPGRSNQGPVYDFYRTAWNQVRAQAGLEDARLYDAGRHTFSTVAQEDCGLPRWRVQLLLGHAGGGITDRYTHVADLTLLRDADRVSEAVWMMLSGEAASSAEVVRFTG